MNQDKRQFKLTTAIFLTLIVVCLISGLMPRKETLQVLVPGYELEYNSDYKIVSVDGVINGKEVKGKDNSAFCGGACIGLEVPETFAEDDSLTVVSTSPEFGMNFYFGKRHMKWYGEHDFGPYSKKTSEFPNHDYFKDMSLSEAIRLYSEKGYSLFASVKGNSFNGFSSEDQKAFKEAFGNVESPKDAGENASYIAYTSPDVKAIASKESAVEMEYDLDGHAIYLYSADVFHGNRSVISIDGKEYSGNRNGLNLVVYDAKNGTLIDSLSYNTNTSDVKMTRNYWMFDGFYTTTINSQLLQQVGLQGVMARKTLQRVYYIIALILLLLYIDVLAIQKQVRNKKEVSTWSIVWRCILTTLCILIAASAAFGYLYLRRNFKDISVEQLVFHMNTNLDGTNWSDYKDTFIKLGYCLGLGLLIGIIGTMICLKLRKNPEKENWGKRMYTTLILRWIGIGASIALMSAVVVRFWNQYEVYDFMVNTHYDATVFKDYYVDPHNVEITFPEKKKNLIYLYLESMEISASDEAHGGGKAFNAIPELTDIALANDNFTNSHEMMNGAIPLTGCTWTIGGIVAQSTGMPLEINHEQSNRNGAVKNFMPGALALGDILEKEGYHNAFVLGSDASFGNRDSFFTEHGNFDIYDYYWARNMGKFPKDYHVWWGYEDKKLFEYAKEQATKLAEGDEPFNLTVLTVDTHFTDGYLCEDCPNTYEQQYSNVLACSSRKVADFVKWVEAQPWGKDTVIILSGDHLCMDYNYYKDMPDGYDRKTYVTVINSSKKQPEVKRDFATIDMFPTTLSALGATIDGDRLGFGTDLYSGKETLLEQLGRPYLDTQFGMYSQFYNDEILQNR